ncbi:DUF3727 domain-containing protein [Leptothermofonsia sp. ETS-13]|uniref:DUF3727 domain-containing protein n=1 Tax=Leptothermofonsia sp. ETS-13 TaxID=3035696 RepID=UPI003BA2E777
MHEDNVEMEIEKVTVTDDAGRTLTCTVEHSLELDGQEYVLLLPIDSPVEIVAWQEHGDEEEAIPVEDERDIDLLFPIAKVVLEEQNLVLKRTAVTLTVEGELPDYVEDEDELAGSEGDEEEEELQFLASFYYEEQEFGVYTPLDPFFILARRDENDQPKLLSAEELEKIEPLLEPLLPQLEEQLLEQFE